MSDKYETYVVKNPTDKTINGEINGGQVTAWSMGHALHRLTDFEEFMERIACGEFEFPADAAARFIDREKSLNGYQ